ncbi:MAG: hypothetical protein F6K16_25820 [Symploca sp. SIO2B6]|nr:hypothetical protein [Symploca sp. SIO2B6]
MNTNTFIKPTKSSREIITQMGWKPLLMLAVFLLLAPVALFLSAGSLNWLMAWLYVGRYTALTAISRMIMMHKSPGLIAERIRAFKGEGVKEWDRALVGAMILCWLTIFIVAGLDRRFGWRPELQVGFFAKLLRPRSFSYSMS